VTVDHPGNGVVRIPLWLLKWLGPMVFGAITMAVSSLVNNIIQQKQQDEALAQLKQQLTAVLAEQKTNSESRIRFEEFKKQYDVDQGSILNGQRVILHDLAEHDMQDRARQIRIKEKLPNTVKVIPEKP